MSIGRASRQWIRRNRDTRLARAMASAAEKYLRAWNNEAFFEFDLNGERLVLERLARWANGRHMNIWDVGAHTGHWAGLANQILPNSVIHSFEIVPATREKLAQRLAGQEWSQIHENGLSDREGFIEVGHNPVHTTTSAIAPRLENELFAKGVETLTCPITTADRMVDDGVSKPDFMKIDVEGHEAAVLRGAERLLKDTGLALIQFEYGDTWLPASETLRGVQARLSTAGYRVGRVYPGYVDLKPYTASDDHFRMGNYIAVRDEGLAELLSQRS